MKKIIRFIFAVDKADTEPKSLDGCDRCRIKTYQNL